MPRALLLPAFLLTLAGLNARAAETMESLLGRMDSAAASFRSLTAKVRILRYTAIVKDETVEEGTIWVKRIKPRVSRLLIEFSDPDRYYFSLSEKKAEIYRPKIATIEEYDISRHRDLADQLWLLSFGAAGRELARSYEVALKGQQTVAGAPAVLLALVPRSEKIRQNVPAIELWVSTSHWQPVQQKLYDITPGDYRLYTYTQMELNKPFPDSTLRIPAASGVRRIHPQKP